MSLYRQAKSGFYWYDFTVEGQRFRGSTKTPNLTKARTVEAEKMRSALLMGPEAIRPGAAPTLKQYSERFLHWVNESSRLEPNTQRYYRYGWRLLLSTSIVDYPINRITADMVETLKFTGCTPKYANQALCTLRRMLSKAVEWKFIGVAPKVRLEKTVGRELMFDPLSETLFLQAASQPTRDVFLLMMDTGMRPCEIVRMRWEDMRWPDKQIFIPRSKTEKGKRLVPMSERVFRLLMDRRPCNEGWIFPSKSRTGHLMSVAIGFNGARRRSGIDPRLVLYSARHTFGTFAMKQTKNLFAVMKTMGHATVRSTERYQHHQNEEIVEAINKRNSYFESRHTSRHTTELVQ